MYITEFLLDVPDLSVGLKRSIQSSKAMTSSFRSSFMLMEEAQITPSLMRILPSTSPHFQIYTKNEGGAGEREIIAEPWYYGLKLCQQSDCTSTHIIEERS